MDTGIGFTRLLLAGLQAAMGLGLPKRMKSHIKIAFGVVQAEGKRQLYLDSCRTRLLDFNMTLYLLTYLNAADALWCARQNVSLDMENVGTYCLSQMSQQPCARDRPYLLRYHDSKARARELKNMEEYRKYTHIPICASGRAGSNDPHGLAW